MNRLCQFNNNSSSVTSGVTTGGTSVVTLGVTTSVTSGVTPGVTTSVVCQPDLLIWSRRKNLAGVHFKVGVNSQVSLLAKDNKVS